MADSKVIRLKRVRLSFPRLFTPKSFKPGQDPRYEATFLLDPSNPEDAKSIAEIKAEGLAVCVARYGSRDKIPKGVKKCFGLEGIDPTTGESNKPYDGYEGMFFIGASNKKRPTVVNRNKAPLTEADGVIYAGCFVEATLTLWMYDNPAEPSHGKKLLGNLRAVRYIGPGEAFGVKPVDADEEFEALEDGTEDSGDAGDDIPW